MIFKNNNKETEKGQYNRGTIRMIQNIQGIIWKPGFQKYTYLLTYLVKTNISDMMSLFIICFN